MNNETMEYFKLWKNDYQSIKYPSWVKEEDKLDYADYRREQYRKAHDMRPLVDELRPLDESTPTWFDALIERPDFALIVEGLHKKHDIWGEFLLSSDFKINSVKKFNDHRLGNVLKINLSYVDKDNNDKTINTFFSETSKLLLLGTHYHGPESELEDCFNVTEVGIANSTSNDLAEILSRVNKGKVINGKTYDEVFMDRCIKHTKYNYFYKRDEIDKQIEKCEKAHEANLELVTHKIKSHKKDFDNSYWKEKYFYELIHNKTM